MTEPDADLIVMPELVKRTGFTRKTIQAMLLKGLPSTTGPSTGRKGRPPRWFRYSECVAWMQSNSITPPSYKNAAEASATPPLSEDTKEGTIAADGADKTGSVRSLTKDGFDEELLRTPGLIGVLERTKREEMYTFAAILKKQQYQIAHPEENLASDIAALQQVKAKQSTQIRQLEKAAIEHKQRCGELVNYNDMLRSWKRLALAWRTTVAGIPRQWPPKLKKYLHSQEMMGNVEKDMDEWIRELLDHIAIQEPDGS